MRTKVLLGCTVLLLACSRTPKDTGTTETTGGALSSWQEVTKSWPEESKSAAKEMTDKYGPPDEMTPTQLFWNAKGPWKKSILSREPVHHEWPSPHEDVLEQFVDYRVPADKVDDLFAFDGSVVVERTKGEMSARCGGESANFLALNLAKDVIDGKRSVADARHFYEAAMKQKKAGDKPDYMTGLKFAPMTNAADPDRAAP